MSCVVNVLTITSILVSWLNTVLTSQSCSPVIEYMEVPVIGCLEGCRIENIDSTCL